jgi:hypothetical protein
MVSWFVTNWELCCSFNRWLPDGTETLSSAKMIKHMKLQLNFFGMSLIGPKIKLLQP